MSVERLIAETLRIPLESVTDDLAFSSIREWDSLSHVNLMLVLESTFSAEIDEDLMVELTSVEAIRRFVTSREQSNDETTSSADRSV